MFGCLYTEDAPHSGQICNISYVYFINHNATLLEVILYLTETTQGGKYMILNPS